MTIQEAMQTFDNQLLPVYGTAETNALKKITFSELFQQNFFEIHFSKNNQIPHGTLEKLISFIERLKKKEPYQYIVGHTEFMGYQFYT